jgi:hypothetical protein
MESQLYPNASNVILTASILSFSLPFFITLIIKLLFFLMLKYTKALYYKRFRF